jgi:hypothetical protein
MDMDVCEYCKEPMESPYIFKDNKGVFHVAHKLCCNLLKRQLEESEIRRLRHRWRQGGAYMETSLVDENMRLKERIIELEKKLKLAELEIKALGGSLIKRSK